MASQNTVVLKTIVNQQQRAAEREARRALFKRCREAIDQLDGEIAGFAVVVWDKQGNLQSAYDAARGPIGPALVPTLVSDALNRHVAVKLAEERLATTGDL